ncbi:hypothetical protein DFR70_103480 [Nocardia tenerifensis]|uniref:Secreted protein n=1 Tax=Nocardia tenerifensis TaxID=228006 RepID=A0A318K5K1_9NOCA|nr:hypothetical protein [Nocardia tenerifensis]PXX66730.1 hypothetical protein DFR70_103480 [Nocardia tenerifensis]
MRSIAALTTAALGALSIAGLVGSGIAAAAPDSIEALEVGDCINYTDRAGTPADCDSLAANYRLVEKTRAGACSDPAATVQFSSGDANGNVSPTYCFVFDWRVGTCYDFTRDGGFPKRDCAAPGNHIGRVTSVHEGVADYGVCQPQEGGLTNDKLGLTVCYAAVRG